MASRKNLKINLIIALVSVVITYSIAELITTYLHSKGNLDPEAIWFHEATDPGKNFQFDSISGFRISQKPSRMGVVATNGKLETIGTMKGNNYGFPDRDDFSAKKQHPDRKRIAVFGDSFSALQCIKMNWPDRAEDILNAGCDQHIQLLNFSVDGGGLGNWWNILTYILEKENFELDGIIFAIRGDFLLDHTFIWRDDNLFPGDHLKTALNYAQAWPPESYPKTKKDLVPHFPKRWYIFNSEEIDQVIKGQWRPPMGWDGAYLWKKITALSPDKIPADIHFINQAFAEKNDEPFNEVQRRFIEDFKTYIKEHNLPILIVNFETYKTDLVDKFAKSLNASVLDGDLAFPPEALENDEISIRYDGHWNQKGSDYFARFMAKSINDWIQTNCN